MWNKRGFSHILAKSSRPIRVFGSIPTNLWYGIEFDVTATPSAVTRIAENNKLIIHKAFNGLPIQNLIKGCILNNDGTVNYYLDPDDWSKKAGGGNSNLDGTDGYVMVEIPGYYQKFETDGNTRRVKICLIEQSGFTYVKKCYVSAYRAVYNRSTLKMGSLKNTSADWRGGDNTSAWDGTYRTLCGKPVTNLKRSVFRSGAELNNKGWSLIPYNFHKNLYWLYVIEYANRDAQLAVNGELTTEGYRQGGIGLGVSTLNATDWTTYNNTNPVIPCGTSDSLANASGEVEYEIPSFPGETGHVVICRYRGIEQPFGELMVMLDGININHVASTSTVAYIVDDYTKFAVSDGTSNNSRGNFDIYVGGSLDGFIKKIHLGDLGDILPSEVITGDHHTEYHSDTYWSALNGLNTTEWKIGIASDNGYENFNLGICTFHSWGNLNTERKDCGTRLSFVDTVPKILSTAIENATPTKIEINFNSDLDENSIPVTTDFTVTGKTVTLVEISGTKLTLTVNSAITGGALIICAYTKPSSNQLKGEEDELYVDSFSQQITNNVTFTNVFKTDGNTKGWWTFDDDTKVTKDYYNRISAWKDKLGSGNDLVQSDASKEPIISSNGITFDGVNDGLQDTSITMSSPVFLYMVIKQISWTNTDYICSMLGGGMIMTQSSTTPGLKVAGGAESAQNDNLAVGSWGIIRVKMKAGGNFCKFQINETTPLTGNWCYNPLTGFAIGYHGNSYNSNILVREIILRAVDESSGDETEIYNYLKSKYGL